MDPISLPPVSAGASSGGAAQIVPNFIADRRPTADAAALARDPRPELPMAVPPAPISGPTQTTAVVRSKVAASSEPAELGTDAARQVDRTLLPYGVKMLPDGKPDRPSLFAEVVTPPPGAADDEISQPDLAA